MAWDRVVELSVGADGQGLLISDLDIDFKIVKSLSFADNYAEFRIYNAKEETRNKVLKKGNNLIFKAGYKDEAVNTLFVGNITEVQSGKSLVDRVVDIQCLSGRGTDGVIQSEYISLSFSPGTLLSRPISQLGNLYGMVVYGLENANIRLPNGWQFCGKASGAFRYIDGILKSNGCGMYKDDKEIVIYKEGQPSKISVVTLTYAGGLKNIKDVTDLSKDTRTKLEFESLIIPQCQVNAVVNIREAGINGVFTVEKLTYQGNNYGGDFNMTGEVYA